jgi:hypothetical protein
MRTRHFTAAAVAVLLLSGLFASGATAASTTPAVSHAASSHAAVKSHLTRDWSAPLWVAHTGPIAQSSPTVATYDGQSIAAVGSENGLVYVLNVATGAELPGWPKAMAAPAGESAAIESSPAIAYLSGPDAPPTVIVGSGSTWVHNSVGEVEAFSITGATKWVFHVGQASGTATGVISSPAVGDIAGNGQADIVFGSWDHNIYALTPAGRLVPGFPFDNADTIWSSPALYKMPGQTREDIFLGSDASGLVGCTGGFVGDYRYEAGKLAVVWRDCENQVIWSSPAVGVLDGRIAVVVGTGFYFQPFTSDTDEVIALNATNGTALPGWPVKTSGPVLGSPAIGLISPGVHGVVDTSWQCTKNSVADCLPPGGPNTSRVYAWNGAGVTRWTATIEGGEDFASPILVPLAGGTINDVLVGSTSALYPLSGPNGHFLDGSNQTTGINAGCEVLNAPALAKVSGSWEVVEACGGPSRPSEIAAYALPSQPAVGDRPGWKMFRGNPAHTGS